MYNGQSNPAGMQMHMANGTPQQAMHMASAEQGADAWDFRSSAKTVCQVTSSELARTNAQVR